MLRFLEQGQDALSSPKGFKEFLQISNQEGEVRYNKDLLPSPPGRPHRIMHSRLILMSDSR